MGRTSSCDVCTTITPVSLSRDYRCDNHEVANATTGPSGGFEVPAIPLYPEPSSRLRAAMVLPSAECTDGITGLNILAPMRCGFAVCTELTELRNEIANQLYLAADSSEAVVPASDSALTANIEMSTRLLGISNYVVDFDIFDPSSVPEAGVDTYASMSYNLALRLVEAWERIACGVLDGSLQVPPDASMEAAVKRTARDFSPTAVAAETAAAIARAAERRPTGRSAVEHGVYVRAPSATAATAFNARVVREMRFRMSALVAGGEVWGRHKEVDSSGKTRYAPYLGDENAAQKFYESVNATATALGVTVADDALYFASVAFANVMKAMPLEQVAPGAQLFDPESELPALEHLGHDEWLPAMETLTNVAFEIPVLALLTHDFVAGNVTVEEYTNLTTAAALGYRISNGDARETIGNGNGQLTVGCMDPRSTTYASTVALHQQSLCLYSANSVISSLESMDTSEWALFIFNAVTALWLVIVISAALVFVLGLHWLVNGVKQRSFFYGRGTPPTVEGGKWPHIAVIVPCFMPNEQRIIEETLERIGADTVYEGRMDVCVPYNTPSPLAIEEKLGKVTELHGHHFKCARVEGSTSKAHNLDYALEHLVHEDASIVVIFDADHHPQHDSVAQLVATLSDPDQAHLSACQGAVLVERGGPWALRHFAGGMEWSSWCFWGPGFGLLCGSAHFGGGNAAWRKKALKEMGFDSSMLTEDIDVTVRSLSKGHRIAFVPWARVGEMCPNTLGAFYKQRLRWAMGWEQVTYRRMLHVFNSQHITEPRKWRTALLLVMRYWSISTATFAALQIVSRPIFAWFGHEVFQVKPLIILGYIQTTIFFCTVSGHFFQLVRQAEPWWRFIEVMTFMPLSAFYLVFQLTLIMISWFKLSCSPLEWVPTARGNEEVTHSIKMDVSERKS